MNKLTGIEFKVVGVTFDNDNGINRQVILATMKDTDPVQLVREPSNKFDHNAVKVMSGDMHMGYVGKQYVTILAPMMDQGRQFNASIVELDKYKNSYYCKIKVDEV